MRNFQISISSFRCFLSNQTRATGSGRFVMNFSTNVAEVIGIIAFQMDSIIFMLCSYAIQPQRIWMFSSMLDPFSGGDTGKISVRCFNSDPECSPKWFPIELFIIMILVYIYCIYIVLYVCVLLGPGRVLLCSLPPLSVV